ncbi:MAG: type II toxin-antitoxin system RelB/DinJ family antitoxin [Coriobacteriales bacterium]|nr:type II toxin-antitoxin system RelB/DinJ family antitoxin [Coriobacteriales bacterium]
MAMTISIDDTLKQEFSDVCAEMGLSASAAFSVFAKAVVREKRTPFEVTSERVDSRAVRDEGRRVAQGIRRGYQEVLEGQFVTREEYERGRQEQHEAV